MRGLTRGERRATRDARREIGAEGMNFQPIIDGARQVWATILHLLLLLLALHYLL